MESIGRNGTVAAGPRFAPETPQRLQQLLLGALFAALFLSLTFPAFESDFWWHLASGRWMFEHRALLSADPFDFTSSVFGSTSQVRYRLTQYWLAQVLLYQSYLLGGLKGVSLLGASVFTGLFFLLFRLLRQAGAGVLLAVGLLALGVQALVRELLYVADRPQMWSSLFFVALLLILENIRAGKRWALAALPPFMLLWANLHGGYILGVIVVVIATAARLVAPGNGKVRLLAAAAAAILLTGCNPSGYEALLSYPRERLSSLGTPSGGIFEEQPLFVYVRVLALPKIMPALAGILLLPPLTIGLRLRTILRERWDILLIYLVTLGLGLKATRFLVFLIPTACWVTVVNIEAIRHNMPRPGWWRFPPRVPQRALGFAATGVMLISLTASYALMALRNSALRPAASFHHELEGAADFLQRNGVKGRLFNDYNMGGYLVWRLHPGMQVFIYGRVAYPELLALYNEVMWSPTKTVRLTRAGQVQYFFQKVFDEHAVSAVILPAGDIRSGDLIPLSLILAQDEAWTLVYAQPSALIFLRNIPEYAPLLRNALPKSAVYDNLISIALAAAQSRHGQNVDIWQSSLAIAYSLKGLKREALEIVEGHLRTMPRDPEAIEFRNRLLRELAAEKR